MKKLKAACSSVLLVSLFFVLLPFSAMASSTPEFSLVVDNNSSNVGATFHVTVKGNNLTDVFGYEINLSFDHSQFQLDSYKAGNGNSGFNIAPISTTDGALLAHTEIGDNSSLNGNADLATLTFKSLKEGNADIKLSSVKLVNAQLVSDAYNTNSAVKVNAVSNGNSQGHRAANGPLSNQYDNDTDKKDKITPVISFDNSTKSVIAKLDAETYKRALEQTASNEIGLKKVGIEIPKTADAKEYVLMLPADTLSSKGKSTEIEIKTDIATITIPNSMLNNTDFLTGDVGIHISRANKDSMPSDLKSKVGDHPAIELNLQSGGRVIPWNNSSAGVNGSIPYTPTSQELQNPEHIVIWYVDGQGNITSIPNGKYDPATGSVKFITTHFSTYAVAFPMKSFNDLQSVPWAQKQIEVMASKGIVNGMSESEFMPSQSITRADFLVLLVRTLELHGKLGDQFADVPNGTYYNEPLLVARGLGITDGIGENKFNPNQFITREDMMVLTARALNLAMGLSIEGNTSELNQFQDVNEISSYAAASIAGLVETGLVQGYNQMIYPKDTTTRAETVVLMYNIYHHS